MYKFQPTVRRSGQLGTSGVLLRLDTARPKTFIATAQRADSLACEFPASGTSGRSVGAGISFAVRDSISLLKMTQN